MRIRLDKETGGTIQPSGWGVWRGFSFFIFFMCYNETINKHGGLIMDEKLRDLYSKLLDSMIKNKEEMIEWDENIEIHLTENNKFEIEVRTRIGTWFVFKEKNKEQMLEWFEYMLKKD